MSVLSARAIAAFADKMKMRPEDAVTFIANANADTRQRIAEQYEPRTTKAERDVMTAEHNARLHLDRIFAVRRALYENGKASA